MNECGGQRCIGGQASLQHDSSELSLQLKCSAVLWVFLFVAVACSGHLWLLEVESARKSVTYDAKVSGK